MIDPKRITLTLPGSKREVSFRSEKVKDDMLALRIANNGVDDKNDKESVVILMQKVKTLLGIEKLGDKEVSISTYNDYEDLASDLLSNPIDYKIIENLYNQFNGSLQEADEFVKNLLSAKA